MMWRFSPHQKPVVRRILCLIVILFRQSVQENSNHQPFPPGEASTTKIMKTKMKIRITLCGLMPGLLAFAAGTSTSRAAVSLNFVSRSAPDVYPDFLRVEAGPSSIGVAGVNGNDAWNDGELATGSQTVTGNSGEIAFATWTNGTTDKMWSQSGSGNRTVALENPSGDMMDGHFEGWNPTEITVNISGLADDYSIYDVYLYVGDDAGGRTGSFSINGSTPVSFTSQLFTGTFVEVTTPGQVGNYIRFSGITGDSFSIVGGGTNIPNRTGLRGIEVVGVPEPSIPLFALAGLGIIGLRRRRS